MRTAFVSVTAVLPIALAAIVYGTVVPVSPARAATTSLAPMSLGTRASAITDTAVTTMDGVYTLAQAIRGSNVFAAYCTSCHSPTFHTGPPFRAKWYGRSLVDLFVYVRREMPKNAPGSMSDADYTLAIAYLLRINGMPTGTKPLPNGNIDSNGGCPMYCVGISTRGGASGPALIIGGFNVGEGNLIAYNGGPGISGYDNGGYPSVGASFDNQANEIHNNRSTDIVFTEYGWIPNDAGDADPGSAYSVPNNKQNYPVIQSANLSGTPGNLTLNVTYLVDSATTNSTYPLRIDFYVDIDEGSGEFLVSDVSYTTSFAQLAHTVSLPLPASVQTLVGFVASATDANGYSSEFSPSYVFDRIFADRFEGH